jgi:hypothetical protein
VGFFFGREPGRGLKGLAGRGFEAHIGEVIRIDQCLDILRRLIAAGDTNGISLAEAAI